MTTTARPAHGGEPADPTYRGLPPAHPAPLPAGSVHGGLRFGQVTPETGGSDGAGWCPPPDPPSNPRPVVGAGARDRPTSPGRGRDRVGGDGVAPIAVGHRPCPADVGPATRGSVPSAAYGEVSAHPQHRDDLEQELRSAADRLARLAAQHGLALAGVFTDVRGRTESDLEGSLTHRERPRTTRRDHSWFCWHPSGKAVRS